MTKKKEEAKQQETTEQRTEVEKHLEHESLTQEQLDDLTNTLQRIQAEFENYKKRTEKEYQIMIKNANAELITQFLPMLDSFEFAIKNSNGNNPEIDKFKKGLEMIYAQFFSTLKDQGLRVIETKNQKFDPYKHEVLMVKEGEQDDMILAELQKGYMLNDKVLRHSKVMITQKKETINELQSVENNKNE
jgi:molecular chaperone GrpE